MTRPGLGRWLGQNLVLVVILLVLTGSWEAGVRTFHVKPYLLPGPSAILGALRASRPYLLSNSLATVETVLVGFGIACGLAVLLALVMLFSPLAARLMQPLIVVSQTLPTTVTAPLLVIWIGWDMRTKVVAVVLNAFFPMVVSLFDGLRSPEPAQVEMLEAAGATRWQVFRKLRLPASLPMLFSGLKVASTGAVTGAMIGEWIVGKDGLGYYVKSMAGNLETADVFAGVLLVSLIGVAFYLVVCGVERTALPWYFANKESNAGGL